MYLQNRHVCVSTELNPSAETQRWPKVTWCLPPLPNEQTRVNGRGGDGPGAQGQRSNLDHGPERKTSRRTRQRDTYEIALGKRPSPVGSLVLDAVGANSVRRKVRGSNLAQPVIPFRSATTLEHVLEFRTSRRTRQQATYEIPVGNGACIPGLVVMQMRPEGCLSESRGTAHVPL